MLRSRPSVNVVERIDRAAGVMIAAPEALEGAGADERRLGPGQPREQGRDGEHDDADEEDPAAAQHVGGSAAEQQEPAEHECVGADHPLEVLLGEARGRS